MLAGRLNPPRSKTGKPLEVRRTLARPSVRPSSERRIDMLRFEEPVYLTVGIGVPVGVTSVEQAFALLNEWPTWRRGPSHMVALNACRAALAGEIDAETAWSALSTFARREG